MFLPSKYISPESTSISFRTHLPMVDLPRAALAYYAEYLAFVDIKANIINGVDISRLCLCKLVIVKAEILFQVSDAYKRLSVFFSLIVMSPPRHLKQAVLCPSDTFSVTGTQLLHLSSAYLHLGAKAQPLNFSYRSGGLPGMLFILFFCVALPWIAFKERLCVWVSRVVKNIHNACCLDSLSCLHYSYAVAYLSHNAKVVSDEYYRRSAFLL